MNRYWLSLGSNLDNPIDQLSRAVNALESLGQVVEVSSLYETDPVGPVAQDCFINLCLTLDTDLAPARTAGVYSENRTGSATHARHSLGPSHHRY